MGWITLGEGEGSNLDYSKKVSLDKRRHNILGKRRISVKSTNNEKPLEGGKVLERE